MKCQLCGMELLRVTHGHLKKYHNGMTTDEYRAKFGSTISPELSLKISNIQKGKKTGNDNPAKRSEVRQKIANSVKALWTGGEYQNRINGMLGKTKENSTQWKPENHTPLFLAENDYVRFLSNFQDVNFCFRCGREDIKINIHHIDENHVNFLPSNLEPLCVPCHMSYHYEKLKGQFIKIVRRFSFAAAHFLPNYNGKCQNLHGHEWVFDVAVKKRIDLQTGMVMDFGNLKDQVNQYIVSELDHSCLNDKILNPTAENLLIWIWEKLMFNGLLKGIDEISIWEAPNSCATINCQGMLSIFSQNIEQYLKTYKKRT